jgi:hypothetical protein
MKRLRSYLLLLAILIAVPVVVDATIQQQRAQITVTITINVTPNPLGMNPAPKAQSGPGATDTAQSQGIVADLSFHQIRSLGGNSAHAEMLQFVPGNVVAQTVNQQKAVKVEAEVSPNPLGTLLVSDQSGVTVNQTAGTTVTYSCLYHVSVTTTITNWSLDHGLYSNFYDSGNSTSFAGSNVANNSYLSTPQPAYTPFVVYSNGQSWALLQENAGSKTYCVSLKIAVPASASQGAYSSQATYTLLY